MASQIFRYFAINGHSLEPEFESHFCNIVNMLETEYHPYLHDKILRITIDAYYYQMTDIYPHADSTYHWVNNEGEILYCK